MCCKRISGLYWQRRSWVTVFAFIVIIVVQFSLSLKVLRAWQNTIIWQWGPYWGCQQWKLSLTVLAVRSNSLSDACYVMWVTIDLFSRGWDEVYLADPLADWQPVELLTVNNSVEVTESRIWRTTLATVAREFCATCSMLRLLAIVLYSSTSAQSRHHNRWHGAVSYHTGSVEC